MCHTNNPDNTTTPYGVKTLSVLRVVEIREGYTSEKCVTKMTEQAKFEGNSDPLISNAGVTPGGDIPTFRNPIPSTSFANSTLGPPVLPPRPDMSIQPSYSITPGYSYGGMGGMGGMGGIGSYGMGGMGSYGNYGGFGGYGGSYGMGGMGGMGGMTPYGGYNRYGPMYGDIESR